MTLLRAAPLAVFGLGLWYLADGRLAGEFFAGFITEKSLSVDNVATQPFPAVFGFQPSALEAVVPEYLAARGTRARYAAYREHARR